MLRNFSIFQITKKRKISMSFIIYFLCFSIISSHVIAISSPQTNDYEVKNIILNNNEIGISNNPVSFNKPMMGNIYIKDTHKISIFNKDIPLIIGPITFKAETEYQDNSIYVIYRFTDLNGNIFAPDSDRIYWNESNPNYEFYYNKIHFPIAIYPILPSKFNIEVRAYWLWLLIGSQNMTVYKIF